MLTADDAPKRTAQATGQPTPYTMMVSGFGLAGIVMLVYLTGRENGNILGAVLGAWAIGTPIAILSGTRSRWDRDFVTGGTRPQRIRAFLTEWLGWTGLITLVLLLVAWANLNHYGFHPRVGYWLIPEITVPLVMLVFRGIVRKIGTALLIALAGPLWTYLLLGIIVLFGPPLIVYLVTIALTHLTTSRR